MKTIPALLAPLLSLSCLACAADDAEMIAPVELTEVWRTGGFSSPESIIPDPETGLFFVSNVNGEGDVTDGNGYISRITREGEIETLEWATGLDAPRGWRWSETGFTSPTLPASCALTAIAARLSLTGRHRGQAS